MCLSLNEVPLLWIRTASVMRRVDLSNRPGTWTRTFRKECIKTTDCEYESIECFIAVHLSSLAAGQRKHNFDKLEQGQKVANGTPQTQRITLNLLMSDTANKKRSL